MAEFAHYYLDFLAKLGKNFLVFFESIFGAISNIFTRDVKDYLSDLNESIKAFDTLGWITLLLVTTINVLLAFFIIYRILLMLRKYLFVRRKEIEKEELLEEMGKLRDQVEQLAIEKNQIFALKLNEFSGDRGVASAALLGGGLQTEEEDDSTPIITPELSRFSKLVTVDNKYKFNPSYISMTDNDMLTLPELVQNYVYYAASHLKLYYKPDVVRQFIAGLATSKVLILEGISGTGKTSLPYSFAKFFDNNASLISVQPSWRDRGELLGYLNEFTKKFNETDFLAAVYESTYRDDINIIVLDEMNLARIEYYFAEFLSVMEMPDKSEWKIELIPSPDPTDPKNMHEGKIIVPQNVWFVGTANQDDSTFTITDKVYDRAIAITLNEKGEFFDAPITDVVHISFDYLESLFNKARSEYSLSSKGADRLTKVSEFIQEKFRIGFGNRILRQINTFVPVYMGLGGTENAALDFMLTTKILKKFSALNLVFLLKELNDLVTVIEKLFGKDEMPMSIEAIRRLEKSL
ncbi:MAG: hypothetical protein LBE09_00550 [Christensenellaceae bacterium]|jgi:hypothetical protein|nr:hypothetical protein [Christensenellaceae bacterium]